MAKDTKPVQPKNKPLPIGLLKHQFKPGMAYMQKLAKGQRGK